LISRIPSSVRQILALLGLLLSAATPALAQKYTSVNLAWDPSPDPDVAGYRIYFGPASGDYTNVIDVGLLNSRTIPLLAGDGTYYFAVTTYSYEGLESDYSNEVNYTPLVVNAALDTTIEAATFPGQPPPPPASNISLQWHSVPGTTYRVLFKNELSETQWTDLSGDILALGPVTTWSEPVLSTVARRFYCVMAVH